MQIYQSGRLICFPNDVGQFSSDVAQLPRIHVLVMSLKYANS